MGDSWWQGFLVGCLFCVVTFSVGWFAQPSYIGKLNHTKAEVICGEPDNCIGKE